jgi:transcriptional regulator with XRE-family HTH domain
MNGTQVQEARENFGLTRAELAQILGVSASTVQRWECANDEQESRIEPLQRRLVTILIGLGAQERAPIWGRELVRTLQDGPLRALYRLLEISFDHGP